MPKKLYIADWHFNHKNALAFDNRPFNSVEEMNKSLIQRWQGAVKPEDTVYVLGDMFWCSEQKAIPIMEQLPGKKILIKGNHDTTQNAEFTAEFEAVHDYLEVEDAGRHVVLCHYPIPCFKNHYYGWVHLYAHVHISFEWNMMEHIKRMMSELYDKPCYMFNVGAMMPWMDYTPRTLDEILDGAATFQEKDVIQKNQKKSSGMKSRDD